MTTMHITTMTMMMIVTLWWTIFLSATTTTTMACRCYAEPTLDRVLQDETVSIFRGMILPRSLFSKDHSFLEYTVLIQKVYQNQCRRSDLAVPSSSSSSSSSSLAVVAASPLQLRAYQTITVISSKNSCGVTKLPSFGSFLFSGTVSYNGNGRTRTLQREQQEDEEKEAPPPNSILNTTAIVTNHDHNSLRSPTLRRRTVYIDDDTPVFIHVNLCSYLVAWRALTRNEQRWLSDLAVNTTTGTNKDPMNGMALIQCSGGN